MKWKSLLAILLGLFILGATGNVNAEAFYGNSVEVVSTEGIYDPNPQQKSGMDFSNAIGSFVFDISEHKVRGTIEYDNKKVSVDWDFSIFKSTEFEGYAFLFNVSRSEDVLGLEAVVYQNGTVWIFARERHGGMIALMGFSKTLVETLSNMNIPSSGISNKEWLWMTLEPEVKTITLPAIQVGQIVVPKVDADRILPMATYSRDVVKIVEKQYSVGWWRWKTTYYIKVALKLYGSTSIKNYGDYLIRVIVLDEGEISNGKRISKNTPLFLGDRGDPRTNPIEVGLWVPRSPEDYIIDTKFTYSGETAPLNKISLGWDLLINMVNPINILRFFVDIDPGADFDDFPDPVNSIRVAYRNIALARPGHWTKAYVHIDHVSGNGYGTIGAFFKVPVYYQVTGTQALRVVGLINTKLEIRAWHS
ncbi:hypothetical protein E3E36_06805 [Thermococcus sp. M36]|uniref:hypothetical protein n=1 Tax=Thermococcus sp. M36 TaxID=1638261 RepID=UPI00143BC438|nr:hypothetical protein [Thermococcus sp. M36]NJE05855.1 hypothetical protein [Thermococcus sp. M36]